MDLVRIRPAAFCTRNLALASCLALGFSAFSGGTAGATVTPATGTVMCSVAAGQTASLTPGLPMAGDPPTAKWTMAKAHQVVLDTCNASGVTGGKSVITDAVLQVNARLNPGASCASISASLGSVNKAVIGVKLRTTITTTVTDPVTLITTTTTQTSTSANVHVKQVTATPSGSGVHLTGVVQNSASGNKPFGGETVDVQLNAAGDCSTAALTSIDLTGSTVSIHP